MNVVWTQREMSLLTAIGTWAGTAIENVRLNQQGRRLAVLEERERIGMDLHDGIIQSIYAVGLALDYARMEVEYQPRQGAGQARTGDRGVEQHHSRHSHLYHGLAPAPVPWRGPDGKPAAPG